jgi:hypothetical protein
MELMPGAPLWDSRVRFAAAERYDLERPQTRAVSSTKEKPAGQGRVFFDHATLPSPPTTRPFISCFAAMELEGVVLEEI